MITLQELQQAALRRGLGDIESVLHTAIVLYEGWEMDNKMWVVKMTDGSVVALTTSHGGLYKMGMEEINESIELAQMSVNQLTMAKMMLKANS